MNREFFIQIFVWLIAILDPIAVVPYYLATNPNSDIILAKRDAKVMAFAALLILLIGGFVGLELLGFFDLEMKYFRIAWWLIIAYNAFRMVNGLSLSGNHEMGKAAHDTNSRWLIIPLTMPLVSWPWSLAFVIGRFWAGSQIRWSLILSIVLWSLLYYFIIRYSVYIQKLLWSLWIALISRFLWLILLGIGIQIILTNI